MRILLTGSSSFTGCWFTRALADAGHEVVVTMTRPSADAYDDPARRERVGLVLERAASVAWGVAFGEPAFVDLVGRGFDVLCHHGADVTDYKSPDFDVDRALASNTRSLRRVLQALRAGGGRRVVLTGSVFEGDEGAGDAGLPHFSPYGLSKALTAQVFRHHCREQGLGLGKFVIPNPFGPMEEPRFTAYLMKTWFAGASAEVKTPEYVRDNIHAGLLAACYASFVAGLGESPGFSRMAPSGYVESQGAFAQRVAAEVRARTGLGCGLELAVQTDFAEPRMRINTDSAGAIVSGWGESACWDAFVAFYERRLGRGA